MFLTAAVALAAAVAFGWSTAAMHSSASRAPDDLGGVLSLVRHLITQRRWLSGMAASLLGLGLHTLALRLGSLAVVQPLVVTGLVFTFLFRAALDRTAPSRVVVVWSGVTAAGLAVFLTAAGSTTGSDRPQGAWALLVLAVGAALAVSCWRGAQGAEPAPAGLLLGAAAGVVFGLIAGTLKAVAGAADLHEALAGWPLYLLLLLGTSGFLLNQQAYRRAPLTTSVPVLNVLNPVVALVYGAVAFRERPASGAGAVGVEVLGLVAVLAGVYLLARDGERAVAAA